MSAAVYQRGGDTVIELPPDKKALAELAADLEALGFAVESARAYPERPYHCCMYSKAFGLEFRVTLPVE